MTAGTPTILKKILARKREEVAERVASVPLSFLIENLVVGEKQVSLRLGLLGGWLVRYRDNEVGLVLCYPFEM